jgi:hypothetical protein
MGKEKSIQNYMKCLGITREEAEQLWKDDHTGNIGAEGEELQTKAKALEKEYTKTEKNKAKRKRVVKPDVEKMRIMNILNQALMDNGYETVVTNTQRQIEFNGYCLTLIKHRPPKK